MIAENVIFGRPGAIVDRCNSIQVSHAATIYKIAELNHEAQVHAIPGAGTLVELRDRVAILPFSRGIRIRILDVGDQAEGKDRVNGEIGRRADGNSAGKNTQESAIHCYTGGVCFSMPVSP